MSVEQWRLQTQGNRLQTRNEHDQQHRELESSEIVGFRCTPNSIVGSTTGTEKDALDFIPIWLNFSSMNALLVLKLFLASRLSLGPLSACDASKTNMKSSCTQVPANDCHVSPAIWTVWLQWACS